MPSSAHRSARRDRVRRGCLRAISQRRPRTAPAATIAGLDDPAGQHRTTGLKPLTHDLQPEFVKAAERAQVGGQEGGVRHVAPIGHPRHEQVPSLLTESTGFGRQRQNSASSSARARPWS